jgi:Asp-tRNA(Asn)/Glu-tRNA(Gln) amidotransferase A subunit family amidase
MSRRIVIPFLIAISAITGFIFGSLLNSQTSILPITTEVIASAERLVGLEFTDAKRDSLIDGLKEQLGNYKRLREVSLNNSVPPSVTFNPLPVGMTIPTAKKPIRFSQPGRVSMSGNTDSLAFLSIGDLASLIKSKRVTSEALTRMYLARLKKYGPKLECVVTLTESLAVAQARHADAEIAQGKYRGLLHGIPYGVKDLLAVKGYPTTWGSVPFKNQIIDENATVVRKLGDAGAVLVAKLTMGELAWGDVWFGGMTRNPWNYDQGSSGSSAGSASATAAGLVAFSIGTETWGSIVSPSTRCGTTGLRPTYGRVSRTGAMVLTWSMDKIGPICRTVEDCAIVFNAIRGLDGTDQTLYDAPFNYDPSVNVRELRVGYLKSAFDSVQENKANDDAALAKMQALGVELIPIELPRFPINDLSIILSVEAGAAFDELTRSGKDDLLVRQMKDAWPNVFRASRFIPAVEYIQANRIRHELIQAMAKLMENIDLYVAPPFEGDNLLLTNLTGHPQVVVPSGFTTAGTPTSITFVGGLFNEATLLAFAKKYQDATDFHLRHPALKE